MKTRYFGILGGILTVVMAFGVCATASAQNNNGSVSDTISSQLSELQNFGTLSIGQTECHTIFLQNTSTSPYVINSVRSTYSQNKDFTVKPIPTLPTILLPGEIVSICDLCFSPVSQPPDTSSSSDFQLVINYAIGSNTGAFYASCNGFHQPDTLLRKPCATFSVDGDLFGPIIMDGDVSRTVTITSNRYDTLWVGNYFVISGADSNSFSFSGITFPYKLSPREVKTFTVTFSPRSNTKTVKYRDVAQLDLITVTQPPIDSNGYPIYYRGQCSSYNFTLAGVAIPPTDPNTPTDLTAGSTDVLAMISDNSVTSETFNFKNTGSTNLKITGVSLKNGKSFAITNIAPSNTLPFTLAPDASMAVTVSMTTVNNGVYYDEVIITAEQGFISMNFELQGLRKDGVPAAVHSTPVASQHISIYPNPTQGDIQVAIPGIRDAKIEVLDVLGKVIATATASEMWNWKSSEPAGTYVVHVSGTDGSGKSFQSYDRFIIAK